MTAPAAPPASPSLAKGPPGAPDTPYVYGANSPSNAPSVSTPGSRNDPYVAQRTRNHQYAAEAGVLARNVLLTAMRMIEQRQSVKGSCYDYIDAVFEEAGHENWRRRETVYRKPKKGPYVSLDLIEPGDWLWVRNSPPGERIKTHSVLFVAWEDRSKGLAYVVSHPGQGRAVSGNYRTYDVSRTYNITRPSTSREG